MTHFSGHPEPGSRGELSAHRIGGICQQALLEQWQSAERNALVSAEEIFRRYPQLQLCPEQQVDIVYNEFLIAQESGGNTDTDVYLRRFPEIAAELQQQFQLRDCLSTGFGDADTESDNDIGGVLSSDPVGFFLHDRYELQQKIGAGGVADVYQAFDHQLSRHVAVKISRTPYAEDSPPFRRFLREAESAARLSHPGIVQVYEFGEFHGRPFIVGQLVSSGTLADNIREVPVTTEEIIARCDWMIHICEAADYAHQCGIVHRDLKPANILFDEHQRPRIADFGLAGLLEGDSTLTAHGDVVGTPAYMSPEQARGTDVGPLSDLYSLGVILYQLLTGELPFSGTAVAILHQVRNEDPPVPVSRNEFVPADLQTICLKAMSRSTDDRYATARDMADDLRRFCSGDAIYARPLSTAERFSRLIRRHPAASLMGLLLLLVSGVTLGGGLQYLNVVTQRDRANAAEAQTLKLLARDSAAAGHLAQQQGFTRSAIERYREAIDRGYEDTGDLLFRIAECDLVHGDVSMAADHLKHALEVGAPSVSVAKVVLLKTRLALLNVNEFGNAEKLLNSLNVEQLDEADRHFVNGLKADTSPKALTEFRRALQLNSHHHPARKSAGVLALSLADFELAAELSAVSRQLFPDDPDFVLIQALAAAGQGDREAAVVLIAEALTDADDQASWTGFLDFLIELRTEHTTGGERVFHQHLSADESELTFNGLVELLSEFNDRFLKQIRERHWHLPPRVESAISEFFDSATDLVKSKPPPSGSTQATDSDSTVSLMQTGLAIVRAHPEGTLSTVIVRQLLDHGEGTREDRQKFQQLFESAMTAKSFAADVRTHAIFGAWAVAVYLLVIDNHEPEENLKRMLQLMDLMSPDDLLEVKTARVMTMLPLKYGRWDYAQRFMSQWVKLAREGDDEAMLATALWTVAIIHEHNEDWLKVIDACEEVIRHSPDPKKRDPVVAPEDLMSKAGAQLQRTLASRDLVNFDQLFHAAIDLGRKDLAESALMELERMPSEYDVDLKEYRRKLKEMQDNNDAESKPEDSREDPSAATTVGQDSPGEIAE